MEKPTGFVDQKELRRFFLYSCYGLKLFYGIGGNNFARIYFEL